MTPLPSIDSDYLLAFLTQLLNIPSPTGYTESALQYVEKALLSNLNVTCTHNHKGALIANISGKQSSAPRGLTAHVDTLGAMVKEIKSNGRLKLSKIGGFAWNTVEGEGCTIFASNGTPVRGSILLTKASAHVYGSEVNDLKREDDNIEVRLDIRTENADQTRQSGIEVGDFVAFDPRVEGVSAAYLLIQRAEKENGNLQIGTGEGIKLGLLVLGLLRQVAQLGEG
jgi:putative aminopeptidase FrvX